MRAQAKQSSNAVDGNTVTEGHTMNTTEQTIRKLLEQVDQENSSTTAPKLNNSHNVAELLRVMRMRLKKHYRAEHSKNNSKQSG